MEERRDTKRRRTQELNELRQARYEGLNLAAGRLQAACLAFQQRPEAQRVAQGETWQSAHSWCQAFWKNLTSNSMRIEAGEHATDEFLSRLNPTSCRSTGVQTWVAVEWQ